MGLIHKLDLDKVTFGDLYRFVNHARSAGIPDDQVVTVETQDAIGTPTDTHAGGRSWQCESAHPASTD